MSAKIHIAPIQTPIGEMVAAATETHLVMFEFEHRRKYNAQVERLRASFGVELVPGEGLSPVFDTLRAELDEYFGRTRREFTIPLLTPGTPFQVKVWDALQRIPAGTTTSYKRLAESIGQPDAVRAVARANGDNRIAIIIPCHRVIGSDGQLVGYGGGLWRKQKLLDLEGRAANLSLFSD